MRMACVAQQHCAASAAATPLTMQALWGQHCGQSFAVRAEQLETWQLSTLCCRAVYELSAVVWHIQDADEDEEGSAQQEGHLVAHIKVQYP